MVKIDWFYSMASRAAGYMYFVRCKSTICVFTKMGPGIYYEKMLMWYFRSINMIAFGLVQSIFCGLIKLSSIDLIVLSTEDSIQIDHIFCTFYSQTQHNPNLGP